MRICLLVSSGLVALAGLMALTAEAQPVSSAPPAGFKSLFNGKDLAGWRGRPGGGGVFSPYVEAKFTAEERAAKQAEWNADRDLHWRADPAKGEIVSDGKGVHLATEKAYGDFEFRVDWMLTQPCGDSGVYLRDYPQVQIWDPACSREQRNGADKGSGGLWNNNPDNRVGYGIPDAKKAFVILQKRLFTKQSSVSNCTAQLRFSVKTDNTMSLVVERKLPAETDYTSITTLQNNNAWGQHDLPYDDNITGVEMGIIKYRIKLIIATDTTFYLDSLSVNNDQVCNTVLENNIAIGPNPVSAA